MKAELSALIAEDDRKKQEQATIEAAEKAKKLELAKENEVKQTGIIVGKLSPGIMITDFLVNAVGDKEKIVLSEKTKKVYNILGDYPDVIANHMVNGILDNTKNNAKIEWLTNRKAAWRFMTASFNKRDFFKSLDAPKE